MSCSQINVLLFANHYPGFLNWLFELLSKIHHIWEDYTYSEMVTENSTSKFNAADSFVGDDEYYIKIPYFETLSWTILVSSSRLICIMDYISTRKICVCNSITKQRWMLEQPLGLQDSCSGKYLCFALFVILHNISILVRVSNII